jgi:hypothetical protein
MEAVHPLEHLHHVPEPVFPHVRLGERAKPFGLGGHSQRQPHSRAHATFDEAHESRWSLPVV